MKVRHIYVAPAHSFVGRFGQPPGDAPMREVQAVECLAGQGLMGDRYLGHRADYKGQITFFAIETHDRLCREFGKQLPPWVYRRNVITHDVDLNKLIGIEFELQGVRFAGTEECRPCLWMEQAFGPGAEEALRGFGGLRARILTDGRLQRDA